jgi:glycerol-3-phosphate dehydrogenase
LFIVENAGSRKPAGRQFFSASLISCMARGEIMIKPWSARARNETAEAAASRGYDLIIIGGGITGAGIARECALRGISFCLLDKKDFAFGTSSRSSKMFHGGMRYLSSAEFGLVRESTSERNWLRHHFPNLVRPLAFVYPSYENSKNTPLKVRAAVRLYDLLSDWFSEYKNYRKARIFKAEFVEELEPAISMEDTMLGKMTMAGFYYDNNCDDARVTLEIIKESLHYSGNTSAALNYTKCEGYTRDSSGRVNGVVARDCFSGKEFEITAHCVVSAAGIWTDQVLSAADYSETRIYPTKGVHIAVPNERLGNRNAFSLISLDDGRFFFILRRGRVSIIGTTDTAYYPESKNLDEPWCSREDCDYLLRTVNRMFPHAMLNDDDIISTFAGIRPLIRQADAKHESDVSRHHEIFQTGDGIVAIAGGKSTTHRRMAEDLIFYLVKHNYLAPFSNAEQAKKGFSKQPFRMGIKRDEFDGLVSERGLLEVVHPDQLEYFYTQYGRGGIEILEAIKKVPESGRPLLKGYPHCPAEIVFILEYENAPKLTDVLCRRTEAQWMIWHNLQPAIAGPVASIMATYYGWSEEYKKAEIEEYLNYIKNTVSFLKTSS